MNKQQSDKFYMEVAKLTAQQSYAIKRKVGAIIVQNDRIISEGFNGTPSGFENKCEDFKCDSISERIKCASDRVFNGCFSEYCGNCTHLIMETYPEVLHAESNAITKCAKYGNPTLGATLYVTCSPCMECSKLIIQAGIKRVVYLEEHDVDGLKILEQANIEIEKYEE